MKKILNTQSPIPQPVVKVAGVTIALLLMALPIIILVKVAEWLIKL